MGAEDSINMFGADEKFGAMAGKRQFDDASWGTFLSELIMRNISAATLILFLAPWA